MKFGYSRTKVTIYWGAT